jgi:mutator protein MutT
MFECDSSVSSVCCRRIGAGSLPNCLDFRFARGHDKLPPMTPQSARAFTPQTASDSAAQPAPVDAAIAIVVRRCEQSNQVVVLVAQRKDDDALGGYWEFPGGKCEEGETMEQCLVRELREELDIRATPLRRLPAIEHVYPDVVVRLHPFICRHDDGEPKLLECQAARWIEPALLTTYQFPPANDALIADVIALLTATPAAVDFAAGPD